MTTVDVKGLKTLPSSSCVQWRGGGDSPSRTMCSVWRRCM